MDFQSTIILIPFVLILLLVVVTKCKDYFSPLRIVNATLIDKYCDTYNGMLGKKTDYFLAFLDTNKRIVLLVSNEVYDSYKKGESGTLTYKNNRIIKFE
jgi:hypothetical protein